MRLFQRAQEIRESAVSGSTLQVDETAGVIRQVKLLGLDSPSHKRRYERAAVAKAAKLYEGRPVNLNHAIGREARVEDRFGWIEGVSLREDGLYGDLHYLTKDGRAGAIVEAAKRRPDLFGLSHNSRGYCKQEKGIDVVYEIAEVRSVDLVADPGTTKSLFESESAMSVATIADVLESADKADPIVKLLTALVEEDMVPSTAEVPMPSGGDVKGAIKSALRSAIMAAFDDDSLDAKATVAKIKQIVMMQDKLMDSMEEKEEATPAAESKSVDALAEKLRLLEARESSRALLESAGVKATPALLSALSALPDDTARKALLEEIPRGSVTVPRGGATLKPQDKKPSLPCDLSNRDKTAEFLFSRSI